MPIAPTTIKPTAVKYERPIATLLPNNLFTIAWESNHHQDSGGSSNRHRCRVPYNNTTPRKIKNDVIAISCSSFSNVTYAPYLPPGDA